MTLKFKNIEGIEYSMKFKKPDGRTWGNGCDGVCFYPKGVLKEADIEVNPQRTDQTIFNTVIHEVTHAYFDELTETEVTKFANTLSRILFNNLQFKSYRLQGIIREK